MFVIALSSNKRLIGAFDSHTYTLELLVGGASPDEQPAYYAGATREEQRREANALIPLIGRNMEFAHLGWATLAIISDGNVIAAHGFFLPQTAVSTIENYAKEAVNEASDIQRQRPFSFVMFLPIAEEGV